MLLETFNSFRSTAGDQLSCSWGLPAVLFGLTASYTRSCPDTVFWKHTESAVVTSVTALVPTATTWPIAPRSRFVDGHSTTNNLFAIGGLDGCCRFLGIGHFHERKTAGTAGFPIRDDVDRSHFTMLCEFSSQVFFSCSKRQIADVNIRHLQTLYQNRTNIQRVDRPSSTVSMGEGPSRQCRLRTTRLYTNRDYPSPRFTSQCYEPTIRYRVSAGKLLQRTNLDPTKTHGIAVSGEPEMPSLAILAWVWSVAHELRHLA